MVMRSIFGSRSSSRYVRAFRYNTRPRSDAPSAWPSAARYDERMRSRSTSPSPSRARSASRSKKPVQEKIRSSRGSAALRAKRRSAAQRALGAAGAGQEAAEGGEGVAGERRQGLRDQHGAEAVVAGEGLVAAVAVQGDLHVAPRFPRHQVRGQRRGVAEGLVVVVEQRLHQLRRVRGRHRLVVLGAEVARHLRGPRALVEEGVALEPHGERLQAPGRVLGDHRRHRARVDAPGQEHAEGDVAHQPLAHGGGEQLAHAIGGFVEADRAARRPRAGTSGPSTRAAGGRRPCRPRGSTPAGLSGCPRTASPEWARSRRPGTRRAASRRGSTGTPAASSPLISEAKTKRWASCQ